MKIFPTLLVLDILKILLTIQVLKKANSDEQQFFFLFFFAVPNVSSLEGYFEMKLQIIYCLS